MTIAQTGKSLVRRCCVSSNINDWEEDIQITNDTPSMDETMQLPLSRHGGKNDPGRCTSTEWDGTLMSRYYYYVLLFYYYRKSYIVCVAFFNNE